MGDGLILPQVELRLETRCRRQIENNLDRRRPDDGARAEVEGYKRRYPAPRTQHRPVGPSYSYNCHGLTFAARRTRIWKSGEIQKILTDDGYEEIKDFAQVMIGDIAIYMQGNEAIHSGLVVEKADFQTRVLSKWGSAHEVLHWQSDCDEYRGSIVKFYRMRV